MGCRQVLPRRALQVLVVLTLSLTVASPAHAYLDPGTGSMILSAVIGVAAALALAAKMFWYRVIGWLRGQRPGPRPPAAGGPRASDE